jgi:broad specificity phosphatase PhoE
MPEPLPELKNSYFLLRHGQSEGNVEGVISSARSLATSEKHGLTKLGYEQGVESATNLLDLLEQQHESSEDNTKNVIFYSSPFSRARQTAQACLDERGSTK